MPSSILRSLSKLKLIATLLALLIAVSVPVATQEEEGATADDALARLKSGNERFVKGNLRVKNLAGERLDLAKGQQPYAIVLACADSRVAPELIFDESLGKLFVVRVAGNVADPVVLGSIEYAVEHLHAKLLMILGHENCGAVKATLSGGAFPPNIEALVKRITPAADKVRVQRLDEKIVLDAAIKENVRYQMQMSIFESEVLNDFVRLRGLKIAGGVYNLHSGKVELVSTDIAVEKNANAHNGGEASPHTHTSQKAGGDNHKSESGAKSEGESPSKSEPGAKSDGQNRHNGEPNDENERAAHPLKKAAAHPTFADELRAAYERKLGMVLKKSMLMRDANDKCLSLHCRTIPAGEIIKVTSPFILSVGGKPQIKVRYKGESCYLTAHESDFEFVER